jgi:hypothetical protein
MGMSSIRHFHDLAVYQAATDVSMKLFELNKQYENNIQGKIVNMLSYPEKWRIN